MLAATAVAGLLAAVAACGGDDSDTATTTAAPETSAPSEPDTTEPDTTEPDTTEPDTTEPDTTEPGGFVEGCDEGSVTDQALIDPTRAVARCEPGFPAPQPLAERETVRVSSAFRLEFNSPLLLAITLGEFEKENIEVEWVDIGYADAVPQMANGSIDVAVGGFEVALFAAGAQGLDVRAVLGNYYPPGAGNYDEPQTGVWCRRDAFTNPDDPDLTETPNLRWSSSVGKGGVSTYYAIAEIERQTGVRIDLTDTVFEAIPNTDAVAALQNNAVQCGVILDPFWLDLRDDPQYFLAASQTPGEPLGQYSYGRRMLENRELGVAFARAFIRTVNTYFAGDYHADDEVMELISTEINREVDALRLVPSLVMDWEIREGTTTRIQEYLLEAGAITTLDAVTDEDLIVDRSFYLEAVGAL